MTDIRRYQGNKSYNPSTFYLIVTTRDSISVMSNNNNDYDLTEREKKVLELYNQGKNTREIAKELRMSLRDISFILKKGEVNHGIATIIDDGNNSNNNKPANEKATKAYKLFSEGKKPVEVAIQLSLSEKEATRYLYGILETKAPIQFISYLPRIKGRSFLYSEAMQVSKKTRNNS